jgi:GcrA cell cycle regulator
MAWDGPKEDLLRKLWGEGLSASQIAARISAKYPLQPAVTRNSVIGKRIRMKLPDRGGGGFRASDGRKNRKRRRKPQARKEFVLFNTLGFIDKNSRVKKVHLVQDGYVPKPEEPAPEHQRKSLLELEEHHCRWPIGEVLASEFHFCGADRVDGLPYCDAHCKRAYVTPAFKVREITKVEVVETEDA